MCTNICQLLKVFNDTTTTLSGVYYPTTNLFIIKTLNIVGVLYDCMSQKKELKSCIEVMKAKWCNYYANIPIIYLLGIIFDPRCKLDMMVDKSGICICFTPLYFSVLCYLSPFCALLRVSLSFR